MVELAAAIAGISSLGETVGLKIRIYTDSKLLVDAFNQNWIWAWAKNNWKKKAGEKVFNADLWKRLLVFAEKHIIDFVWIKGHDGIPENEQCDSIARSEASKPDLAPDIQYEEENSLWENPIPYDIETHNISTKPTESKIIDDFVVHLSTDDSSQKFTFIAKNKDSYFYGNFDKKDTGKIISILEKLKGNM